MTLALVAVAATSAFAQLSVGAGYLSNTQKYTYPTGSNKSETATTPSSGFYVGGDYTLDLGQGLGVSAGLKGAFLFGKLDNTVTTSNNKLSEIYLAVPVMANYTYAISNDFKVFALAGPSIAFGLSSKYTGHNDLTNNDYTTDRYDEDAYPSYGKVNVFLGLGAGVDILNTVRVKVGYDIGLLNRTKEDNQKINDAQLYFGVAYLF